MRSSSSASASASLAAAAADSERRYKTVLVTVGTTRFDALVQRCCGDGDVLALLARRLGCERLLVQHGAGAPPAASPSSLAITAFDYTRDMAALQREADLIISHAGAGSIFEALALRKPLLVVVNEALMDNHQSELAAALHDAGHLYAATCGTLASVMGRARFGELAPLPPPRDGVMARVIGDELSRL